VLADFELGKKVNAEAQRRREKPFGSRAKATNHGKSNVSSNQLGFTAVVAVVGVPP